MGYRSEVVIAVRKEVKAWALIANKPWPKAFNDADEFTGATAIYYRFDWVKWSDEFNDVAEVNHFLAALDEECPEIQDPDVARNYQVSTFGFLRVGEELGDVETYGDPSEFNLWAHTVIAEIDPI